MTMCCRTVARLGNRLRLMARDEGGFTLTEMLVTMAMMGIVIAAVASLFTSGSRAEVDLNLRFASQTRGPASARHDEARGAQRLLRHGLGTSASVTDPNGTAQTRYPDGRAPDTRLGVRLHRHERQLVHRRQRLELLALPPERGDCVQLVQHSASAVPHERNDLHGRDRHQSAAHRRDRHDRQPEAGGREVRVPDLATTLCFETEEEDDGGTRSRIAHNVRERLRDESGMALVMAIGVSMVIAIMGASLVLYSTSNEKIANRSKGDLRAYQLAQSGIDSAASVIAQTPVTNGRQNAAIFSSLTTAQRTLTFGTGESVVYNGTLYDDTPGSVSGTAARPPLSLGADGYLGGAEPERRWFERHADGDRHHAPVAESSRHDRAVTGVEVHLLQGHRRRESDVRCHAPEQLELLCILLHQRHPLPDGYQGDILGNGGSRASDRGDRQGRHLGERRPVVHRPRGPGQSRRDPRQRVQVPERCCGRCAPLRDTSPR